MSAAVCGSKRSFFEDIPPSPPVSKRLRCSSSTSPIRLSASCLVDQLRAVFPHMEHQLLERALQECDNDLDAAIESLHELCLGSAGGISGTAEDSDANVETGTLRDRDASVSENQSAPNNLPADGAEWVDLFVREMMGATSIDDARTRAARMLEVLESKISGHASAEATHVIQKENMMLKEQIEGLTRENTILKSAFKIQHERQIEHESRSQELQHLKQLVSQYQDQLRTLEMNNYALAMHLKQAQQCNSLPGRFHPDVF